MKKRNLTATFLGCALCAAMMAASGCGVQPCYTDDDVESVVAESAAYEAVPSYEVEAESSAEAETAMAEEQKPAQVDAEIVIGPNSENEDSSSSKPAAQAASQPQVKKAAQSSVVVSKQQPQAKPAVERSEAEPGEGEADDEVLMVIDAIPAAAEETVAKARTITINGVAIDYVDSFGTSSAPDQDAGLWTGSDSTTDGSLGYFIGHDYTDFGDVANLEQGSVVSVTDSNGDSRDYEVVDSFVVPEGSHWSDISSRVTGHGESIVMQTCVDDGYMIVVAE